MKVKDLFAAIEFLFVEVLFIPFDFIRLEISNWIFQNAINFSLMLVIASALVYWTLQLIKFDKSGEEDKDVTAHSFLYIKSDIFSKSLSLKLYFRDCLI